MEAGLGGRYDATNVLDAPVVALTNVGLDHVEQLGGTREAIAAEKLAVLAPGADLVAGSVDAEIEVVIRRLTGHAGSVRMLRPGINVRGRTAAGRPRPLPAREPGAGAGGVRAVPAARRSTARARSRRRRTWSSPAGCRPSAAIRWCSSTGRTTRMAPGLWPQSCPPRCGDRRPLVGVIAILADKDVDGVLDELVPSLQAAVATQSGSPRALDAADLAARIVARGVPAEVVTPPSAALARAREQAGRGGRRPGLRIAVAARGTGAVAGPGCGGAGRMARKAGGLGVVAFALAIILTVVLLSYAVGYLVGRILL